MMSGRRSAWQQWLVWSAVLAAATLLLLVFRPHLDKAHVTLVYLLVVLGGSVSGGRRLGLALAGIAFVLFNWFFLPPFGTLDISNPLDWLILVAFLVVSIVSAQMLHRLHAEAEVALGRAAEIDRFATLGAETLNVARADEALAAIAEVIRSTLALTSCQIHMNGASAPGAGVGDGLVHWVAGNGRAALRLADGTTRLAESPALPETGLASARSLLLPLQVRERTVGVLELVAERALILAPAQRRFLIALAYYAALAVERARLAVEADHAEALREADRLKDALLASVSHDLRTPLTTIRALAHDLSRTDDRAAVIVEESDRLSRLVADLLDLSRLHGGALPLTLELNAVDELVGALLQRTSGVLGDRKLRVDLEEGGTLLVGRFDFAHALRILVNLVENAHKYAPHGSVIDLVVRRDGARLVFEVSDRGPGILAPERERIFDPFYRPPGTPPDVGGAGLGLAIARQLAEAQGGALAHAPRPGGGTTFTLALPAADLTSTDLSGPPPGTLTES